MPYAPTAERRKEFASHADKKIGVAKQLSKLRYNNSLDESNANAK
jgi:hypothetical protein